MNDRLREALIAVVGREPTPEEVSKFHRVKDALGLEEHDAIWTFLVAFGHYEILYQGIPDQIKHAALEIIAAQRAMLEPAARAIEERTFRQIEGNATRTVERIVEETLRGAKAIQDHAQKKRLTVAIALSLGIAAICILVTAWGGYIAGRASAQGELSWLESAQGRAAREFARLNDVNAMLACEAPLTRQVLDGATHCVPYEQVSKKVRMWRVR